MYMFTVSPLLGPDCHQPPLETSTVSSVQGERPTVMDVRRILHRDHQSTLLSSLQTDQCLVDVSLVCQTGEMIKTHKIVLAAASPLLRSLLQDNDKKV